MFKKKNIKTGEIVLVTQWQGEGDKRRKTDWVSYIDSKLEEHPMTKGLNFYWDFDDLDWDEKYGKSEHQKAAETHFCMFAGMAMQGQLSNGCQWSDQSIVDRSIKIAKMLTDELAKWKFDTKKEIVFREDNELEEQEETTKDC